MPHGQEIFTKEGLIAKLAEIEAMGFVPNARHGNHGGVGNTLEDLLGIEENNLPIPNAAEWELKTHRKGSSSLVTLFHSEPSPRAVRFVPRVFLPLYGWQHQQAGEKYPATEMSFRQTISGARASDRGFRVVVDRDARKVLVSFDAFSVDPRHHLWLAQVKERAGLAEVDPQPYWGFDDLAHDAGAKLHNSFFVEAEVKRETGHELYHYSHATMLSAFSLDHLLAGIESGVVYVDFDARSGHNHGTKFRVRSDALPMLYSENKRLF
ncbi:MAG: MvaI/BcnI restriction endonuclease family protein [Alphaproteobacteria bacterium]|nr:MvaI/BcnI restriction endonuclease family protein [Alphaproteobacteria bacterium]MBM3641604.1 MvaI/BcnI restriction endonuclease family protein [Alphaproteobacteria bacterium]